MEYTHTHMYMYVYGVNRGLLFVLPLFELFFSDVPIGFVPEIEPRTVLDVTFSQIPFVKVLGYKQ